MLPLFLSSCHRGLFAAMTLDISPTPDSFFFSPSPRAQPLYYIPKPLLAPTHPLSHPHIGSPHSLIPCFHALPSPHLLCSYAPSPFPLTAPSIALTPPPHPRPLYPSLQLKTPHPAHIYSPAPESPSLPSLLLHSHLVPSFPPRALTPPYRLFSPG